MAKQTGVDTGTAEAEAGTPEAGTSQSRQDNLALAIEALTQAAQSLVSTTNQLMQFAQGLTGAVPAGPGSAGPTGLGAPVGQINAWEDDPFSEAVATPDPTSASPIAVSIPLNSNPKLQTAIVEPRPSPARYNPGNPNFRYWATAEALAQGINFWGPLLPSGTTWSTSNPMKVTLIAGQDLNANYSRAQGLRFYQQTVRSRAVFSCESPDVACHELGHAILDALRPQLFNVASIEAGAFHESLGDMSAILIALQRPSLLNKVLAETNGRLNVNSRLSRLAEQLGWAIRQLSPTAVDRDCLRNAANRFVYKRPDLLPFSAPASMLSSEVHSFSRVFTGAFLDALARMFATTGAPNAANLLAVSRDIGQILVDGILSAPITPAYYSQVAAAMVQADRARNGGRYRAALTSAFVEHGILSMDAPLELADAPIPQPAAVQPGAMVFSGAIVGSPIIYSYEGAADEGYRLGYGETPELPTASISIGPSITINVHAPEPDQNKRFSVFSTRESNAPQGDLDSEEAARYFVEGLIQLRRLNLGAAKGLLQELSEGDPTKKTHVLVADSSGTMVLKRDHFDCGFCCHRVTRPQRY